MIDNPLNEGIIALHAGCSYVLMPGWINVDMCEIPYEPNNDNRKEFIQANLGVEWPFNTCFDYIYSEHLIEHLTFNEFKNYIQEAFRCLRPGGVIRTAWPSLEFNLDLYYHPGKYKEYIEDHCYRFHPSLFEEWESIENIPPIFIVNDNCRMWGHQIMYDVPTVIKLFNKYGFENCHQVEYGKSDLKIFDGIEHDNKRGERFNKLETVVIECTKPLDV